MTSNKHLAKRTGASFRSDDKPPKVGHVGPMTAERFKGNRMMIGKLFDIGDQLAQQQFEREITAARNNREKQIDKMNSAEAKRQRKAEKRLKHYE